MSDVLRAQAIESDIKADLASRSEGTLRAGHASYAMYSYMHRTEAGITIARAFTPRRLRSSLPIGSLIINEGHGLWLPANLSESSEEPVIVEAGVSRIEAMNTAVTRGGHRARTEAVDPERQAVLMDEAETALMAIGVLGRAHSDQQRRLEVQFANQIGAGLL